MKGNLVKRKLFGQTVMTTFLLMAIMLTAALLITTTQAFAITTTKLPNNDTRVPGSYTLAMGYGNMTSYEINSAYSGVVKYDAGNHRFTIPRSTTNKTYTNPLTIHFANCGTINGRQLNIDMKINSLTQKGGSNSIANNDGVYLELYSRDLNVTSWKYNSSSTYRLQHTIDISYTVKYADTGATVSYPFFQSVFDLDTFQNVADYAEGIVPISGYEKAYLYPGTQLKQQNGGFFAPGQMEWGGNDSIVKGGVYLVTSNGAFRSRNYVTNCKSTIQIYSQYNSSTLPSPILSISAPDKCVPGDTVIINVKQQIGTMYVNTFTHYSKFEISDDLPKGVTYKSAKVIDGNGNDVTSKGTISYNSSTRTVTFRMNASNLTTDSIYNGGTYTLQITTIADDFEGGSKEIDDTGLSNISEVNQETNEDNVTVYKPFHVNYKYVSGTEGRNLPKAISTTTGAYKISDSGTYYTGDTVTRKTSPADGTFYDVYDNEDNYVGRWTLTWDASKKTVGNSDVTFTGTWVYTPAPRLVIMKKLDNDSEQFTEEHGEPTFLYKITGSAGKVWYKSITYTENAVNSVQSGAKYTTEDGTQFKLSDGYIYAAAPAIYLPEDDYKVEELSTIRFDEISCTAQYHNEGGTKNIGSSKTSITVPLKLSTYKQGSTGFGADYASVCFENDKARWDKLSHNDIIINELEAK